MRILLVENDELTADTIKTSLSEAGYVVDLFKDGAKAKHVLLSEEFFDLVILDLGLPKVHGSVLLQMLQSKVNKPPIIIVTAAVEANMHVKTLDAGADDFLSKPIDLSELKARIRALLRRTSTSNATTLSYRDVTLDPISHKVTLQGKSIDLSRREFALLHKLLQHIGQVVSRDHLMQSLYGWEKLIDSNALEVHVFNIRKKLGAHYLKTIRGVGYIISDDNDVG